MRLEWNELINRTAAPFTLTYVPSWTGLERVPRAMERRGSRAAAGDVVADAPHPGRHGARSALPRMQRVPAS